METSVLCACSCMHHNDWKLLFLTYLVLLGPSPGLTCLSTTTFNVEVTVSTDIMGEGHSSSQCGSFLILSLSFLFLFTLVLNMFVQENTVTVVQEFHRPLPMRDDSLEPVISHEVPARKVPKDCQPQTKLAFAKTHKTGGMFPHSRVWWAVGLILCIQLSTLS